MPVMASEVTLKQFIVIPLKSYFSTGIIIETLVLLT